MSKVNKLTDDARLTLTADALKDKRLNNIDRDVLGALAIMSDGRMIDDNGMMDFLVYSDRIENDTLDVCLKECGVKVSTKTIYRSLGKLDKLGYIRYRKGVFSRQEKQFQYPQFELLAGVLDIPSERLAAVRETNSIVTDTEHSGIRKQERDKTLKKSSSETPVAVRENDNTVINDNIGVYGVPSETLDSVRKNDNTVTNQLTNTIVGNVSLDKLYNDTCTTNSNLQFGEITKTERTGSQIDWVSLDGRRKTFDNGFFSALDNPATKKSLTVSQLPMPVIRGWSCFKDKLTAMDFACLSQAKLILNFFIRNVSQEVSQEMQLQYRNITKNPSWRNIAAETYRNRKNNNNKQ